MPDLSSFWKKTCLTLLLSVAPLPVMALDVSGITTQLPDESRLNAINTAIESNPQNLDNYYKYATTAAQMRDYKKAAAMYERMLAASPNLPRIKLELAMSYMQLARFDEAKRLVDEVLKEKLPPQVRKNLEPVAAQLDQATKRNSFSGSFALGATYDTNANAAPESGIVNIRFAGQELPFVLTKDGRKRGDAQAYAALTLAHQYRHPTPLAEGVQGTWQSSATYYRNQYHDLSELNIGVASVRTGPVVSLMDGKAQAGVAAGYDYITLDNNAYLKQYLGEITLSYAVDAATRLRLVTTKEWRNYVNSPTIRSFDLRDGQAEQVRVGVTRQLTGRDTLDGEIRFRSEDTERRYYDLHEQEYQAGYVHQFDAGWFAGGNASYRTTEYDKPDPAISGRKRKEQEWDAGVNVGRELPHNVTLTAGYDYRNIKANITNYRYDDHRITTGLGWRF